MTFNYSVPVFKCNALSEISLFSKNELYIEVQGAI